MFTGIIEELGEILAWEPTTDAARLTVRAPLAVSDAKHGDSISVSGVCLTVVEQGDDWFTADVMAETIAMSTLGGAIAGRTVNIERAAQVGDRLGGHIVQGHIDGTSTLLSVTEGGAWRVLRFSLTPELAPLVARKGSIAIDGVSLTVSAVGIDWLGVSLIPETLVATTLGAKTVGDDETWLLRLVAAWRKGDEAGARALIAWRVQPEAQRWMRFLSAGLVRMLDTAE